jgi:hypothetical protein
MKCAIKSPSHSASEGPFSPPEKVAEGRVRGSQLPFWTLFGDSLPRGPPVSPPSGARGRSVPHPSSGLLGVWRLDFVLHFVRGSELLMFSLEKLKVYDRALSSAARLIQLLAGWDKRHAVVDQLLRASESVVLNIGEAARLRGSTNRQHTLDYAIGSALECAACLDVG